jgi:hypothetical protein
MNVGAVTERQLRVEATVESISNIVQHLAANQTSTRSVQVDATISRITTGILSDMQLIFNEFTEPMNIRLDQLNAVFAILINFDSNQERATQSVASQLDRKSVAQPSGVTELNTIGSILLSMHPVDISSASAGSTTTKPGRF